MGYTNWSRSAYDTLKTTNATKTVDDIFISNKTKSVHPDMNPYGLKMRECRDSISHPQSLAIQFWLDETGSMGQIPEHLIRFKLDALIETMLKHNISDPAVLFGGIGDHYSDNFPLQVGQFESGTAELSKWLTGLYLEGRGGGQNKESYLLAWLIAGRYTSIDCFEKRGKKGYLFTVGDEKTWETLSADVISKLIGGEASDVSAKQLLAEASRMYHVYHIHVNSTSYKDDPDVINSWKELLGERLIVLDDTDAIAEVVASTVAIMEGIDKDSVLASFDSNISKTLSTALVNIDSTGVRVTPKVIEF